VKEVDIALRVAAVIRVRRKELALSASELAYRAKVECSDVLGIENGSDDPNLFTLYCLSSALDLRLSQLLELAECSNLTWN
jgi:transcriptional regulator with XRE-family HTH domain